MQKRLKHIQQPHGSRVCGQTVVAMICGITIDQACILVGRRGATTSPQIREGLLLAGYDLGKPVRGLPPLGVNALVRLRWFQLSKSGHVRQRGHWVLKWADIWHDPSEITPGPMIRLGSKELKASLTSYWPISKIVGGPK